MVNRSSFLLLCSKQEKSSCYCFHSFTPQREITVKINQYCRHISVQKKKRKKSILYLKFPCPWSIFLVSQSKWITLPKKEKEKIDVIIFPSLSPPLFLCTLLSKFSHTQPCICRELFHSFIFFFWSNEIFRVRPRGVYSPI